MLMRQLRTTRTHLIYQIRQPVPLVPVVIKSTEATPLWFWNTEVVFARENFVPTKTAQTLRGWKRGGSCGSICIRLLSLVLSSWFYSEIEAVCDCISFTVDFVLSNRCVPTAGNILLEQMIRWNKWNLETSSVSTVSLRWLRDWVVQFN